MLLDGFDLKQMPHSPNPQIKYVQKINIGLKFPKHNNPNSSILHSAQTNAIHICQALWPPKFEQHRSGILTIHQMQLLCFNTVCRNYICPSY